MELLVLLIRLISRAFDQPKPQSGVARKPDDLVRQIQARIEAARLQTPQGPQPPATRPMMARLPPARRVKAPLFKGRKGARRGPPALPAKPVTAQVAKAATPAPVTAPAAAKPVASVDAKLLSRWLRPQTLRTQFILTEIFQPPVALRESRLS
jgi:hypothetical protein